MSKFYAVARGWQTGIYKTWSECSKHVFKFPHASFKKFESEEEAKEFIEKNGVTSIPQFKQAKRVAKTKAKLNLPVCESDKINELGLIMKDGFPVVYTDGACSNNGSFGSKAGIGVYWGDDHKWNISAPITGRATNNAAEYTAIIFAMEKAISEGLSCLLIRTDSRLIISSMNEWIRKWKQNDWKTYEGNDVKNRELLERIDELKKQIHVLFEKVSGHSGDYCNDQADKLAKEGAKLYVG